MTCIKWVTFLVVICGGKEMRKAQKQEVLEMIQTLHQAHDEVKNYIDKRNYVLAQDLLSQCQECAISIGTAIENLEGEGFVTVSYVESYCDVIFSIYEELNGNDTNANKTYKNLKKQLLRIENSVKNDVPVRKEIAFFPYKASMWDSLESVYLAAKEDPDCDAYCVPIPYYDRNSDRSLGEMHYEGREYPKNIEVIDWQTYNFEERKPDVVYIHNPYDDWNLVTCVHPRFFSANLKKYTEELVYIPYFVLDEIEPNDQPRIETMKHFIWTPGVINADKVIVQSEKMKQIYVNEYLKAAQANKLFGKHIDRKKLEEKFLGLGSPKFDKVKNTKKEDLDIPEEWLKIIEKPDGSWKKIIFYNTSVGTLLERNEKMLEKMEWVFKFFKENKDEIALLWRPHPLIKTTVSAMRPKLWETYNKLVQQYKSEGWGIYDDTVDMDRAVVLSDAYYGDRSSVVQVCQQVGMPVLIQHPYANGKGEAWTYLPFAGGVIKDEKIWCINFDENALYTIEMATGQIDYIDTLKENRKLYFGNVFRFKDRLLLIPWNSTEIGEYDTETREKKYHPYENACCMYGERAATVWDKYLYVFPYREEYIFKLNILTGESYRISLPIKAVEHKQKDDMVLVKHCTLMDEKVVIPYANSNKVLVFELETERVELKKWEEIPSGFEFVTRYDDDVYFLDKEKNLYRTPKTLDGKLEKVLSLQGEYRDIKVSGNKLVFIFDKGMSPDGIRIVDLMAKTSYIPRGLPKTAEGEALPHFSSAVCGENICYFIPGFGKEIIAFNVETNSVESKTWYLSKMAQNHIEKLTQKRIQEGIILEEGLVPLKMYLKMMNEVNTQGNEKDNINR